MLIVAGHLVLDPTDRDAHVLASVGAVRLARATDGCEDFAVSADAVDPGRVNVFERWSSPQALRAFREGGGDDGTQVDLDRVRAFHVEEYVAGDAG